jgi:transcriptional regulator GlxA family with amidase domain
VSLEGREPVERISGRPVFIETNVWKRVKYYSCTRKALEYLENTLDTRVDMKEMAAMACMERTSFSKAFRRRIGMTPYQFIQAYRISLAAVKMEISDDSITEIAFSVGFGSLDAFGRAFKRVTGIAPSHYRRELLRGNGVIAYSVRG